MTQPPPLPPQEPQPPQAPPPRAQQAADRARQHVTEQTRTYPCGSCGAPLAFSPERQDLSCRSCGRAYPIELDPSATVVKHDLQTAMASIASGAVGLASVGGDEHEVVCQSCGGRTVFNGSLTATRCPYCATPIQRDDIQDSPERFALDAIVPLRVGEPQAREAIEKWINSRWFAPREFKKYRTLGSFTSVYLSYYSYDADTTTGYHGQRGDTYTVTVGSGDNRRTETRIRWRPASGVVRNTIRDLPELSNTGMDGGRIRELEPWPIQTAVPYSPEFVAGHLSRTYDRDPEDVFAREARPRIDSQIETTIRRDIGGDHQRISSKNTTYGLLQFMYLLLPMWLLTVNYDGKPFQVFVNGLTGEVQGERPWSKVKIAAAVIAALIVICVVAYLIWGRQ
ncbi:Trm112 family protein [Gordonia liuliyuniae]|uniref:Replication restart DNA helicase PriA n=1 Tax=Gordonia liuliyuniae TaxID=2911517 RepID=A0ABS9IPS6_9ACTN|nr:Trm112 family protein [Gordonia liuliyuniae]MCF8587561.1 hypothetical protein [Gordonia liuliyuniae]